MREWSWLWFASFVAAALTSAMLAQNRLPNRVPPRILSGSDIGFRVERTDPSGRPVGTWLLRIDGDWVEISPEPIVRRLN